MVVMKLRGQKYPVYASKNMMSRGWYGGQWVKYVGKNTVDFAGHNDFVGFMLLGYKLRDTGYIPYQHENVAVDAIIHPATMINDSGFYDFSSTVIEPVVYSINELLYVSNNGFLTNVDAGGPIVGRISAIPSENNGLLGTNLNINF